MGQKKREAASPTGPSPKNLGESCTSPLSSCVVISKGWKFNNKGETYDSKSKKAQSIARFQGNVGYRSDPKAHQCGEGSDRKSEFPEHACRSRDLQVRYRHVHCPGYGRGRWR